MTQQQIRRAARRLVLEILGSIKETPWIEDGDELGDERVVREASRILDGIKARLAPKEKK